MKTSIPLTLSLRTRLIVALAVMLLPLLVLGASTFYTFNLMESAFREVVDQSSREMIPATELQVLVQNCRIALHHLGQEQSAENRRLFSDLVSRVGKTFARILDFKTPVEQRGLAKALSEWQQAERAAADVLAIEGPFDTPEAREALVNSSLHFGRVQAQLEELRGIAAEGIAATLERVAALERRSVRINLLVFLAGMALVLGLGLLLARHILRPMEKIGAGVQSLADGDLAHRLETGRQDELGALSAAFNAMAAELERERRALKELSVSDPLTGLCNQREFFRLLREETERSRRYRHPLSLMMIDLDKFKRINDTYGHPAGDRVLCTVAGIVRRELRQVDHVARYGGEEFAVILPETGEGEAFFIANRIRQAIAARPLPCSDVESAELTISIGLAVFPDHAGGDEELVKKADQALYAAKAAGRNRVCRST